MVSSRKNKIEAVEKLMRLTRVFPCFQGLN